MKKDVTKMCYLLILYSKARNEFGIPHRIYEKDKNNSNLLHSKLNTMNEISANIKRYLFAYQYSLILLRKNAFSHKKEYV